MVNDIFTDEPTPGDKSVYVNNVIEGKLLECETLRNSAAMAKAAR